MKDERKKKPLDEMTLEELWQLFPIYLVEHQACWSRWFDRENCRLAGALPAARIKRICHIGSTAVPGIAAKPIVDILVEVFPRYSLPKLRPLIEQCGYLCMAEGQNRISFNKGYTPDGFARQVFHLHLRYAGDNDELYFRDYLREHPECAKEYEALKFELWKAFPYNRDAYTEHKTDFVRRYTARAKALYGGRYA